MYKIDFSLLDEKQEPILGKLLVLIEDIKMGPDGTLILSPSGKAKGFRIIFRVIQEGPYNHRTYAKFYGMEGNENYVKGCLKEVSQIFDATEVQKEEGLSRLKDKVLIMDFDLDENGYAKIQGYYNQRERSVNTETQSPKSIKKNVGSFLIDEDLNDEMPF
jgi:hypothetical protein